MKKLLILMAFICSCAYAQNNQGTYTNKNNSMSCDSTCLFGGQAVMQSINQTTANGTYSQALTPQTPQQQPQQCKGGTQPVFYYGTNTPVYNGSTPVCCPNGYTQQYVGGGQLLYIGNKNACIPIQTN